MPNYLRVTLHFLQPACHGRGDRGEPEWPPSPLRLFQAMVSAAAARWNERTQLETATPALRWLEAQPAPTIIAPAASPSDARYRLYVPDNVGDLVAGSWSRGGTGSMADYRTEKDVRPTRLQVPPGDLMGEEAAVHYLWEINGSEFEVHQEILLGTVRSITHLGWGVDMVAAEASIFSDSEAKRLDGERWRPVDDRDANDLRVAVPGTLAALLARHAAFLDRVGSDGFRPVPPLTMFRTVGYRRATDAPGRAFAAFSLLKPDASGFRIFDPARQAMEVSGMMRHAASRPSIGWEPDKVARFVLGHGESVGQPHRPVDGPRLAFLPLPSIESRGGKVEVVGAIRRVLVTVFNGTAEVDLRGLARSLSGVDLVAETGPGALLARIADSDKSLRRYREPATTWATVTPIVLPGHDDPRKIRYRLPRGLDGNPPDVNAEEQGRMLAKLDARIDQLLRKAIRQAGYSDELALHARIEWRSTGFWPGTGHVQSYAVPDQLRRFRRLHARITWHDQHGGLVHVPGPICLGGGRFRGIGLLASQTATHRLDA